MERLSEYSGGKALYSLVYSGASCMSYANGNPGLFGYWKVNCCGTCHMSLYHLPFIGMFFKELLYGLFIFHKVCPNKFRKTENSASQLFYARIKIVRLANCHEFIGSRTLFTCFFWRIVYKKIKLDLVSIHVAIQINNTAFCAAYSKSPKNMKHPYLSISFFHIVSPSFLQLNDQKLHHRTF